MSINPFALERYFSKYEFNAQHLLCCSDCEPFYLDEVIQQMDDETRKTWNSLSLGYTESAGLPALTQQICTSLYETVRPENILVAAPSESIFLIMNALLEAGDEVVCMFPAYQSLYEIARSCCHTNIIWWTPRENTEDGSLYFDVNDLRILVQGKNIKLVIVNTPHNPTGWLATHKEWAEIHDICRTSTYSKDGAYLFSDEMYRGLELDANTKLRAAVDAYQPFGISLCGMSKCFGGPGLRIGWLAMCSHDKDLLEKAAKYKDYTTICPNAPSQVLALALLKRADAICSFQVDRIRKNLEIMEKFAQKWKNLVEFKTPQGGTVAFPKFNFKKDQGITIENSSFQSFDKICKDLVEKYGVMLLPSSVYRDSTAGQETDGILLGRCRIGYGRNNFKAVLQEFEDALIHMGYTPT